MLKKLVLKNWQSHLDSVFEFGPGINGIIGVIGSGKSSVLNAICFAFYGTYPTVCEKKKKIDDVIMNVPNQMKEASVELAFEKDGEGYSLKRVIKLGKGTALSEFRKSGKLIEGPNSQRVSEAVVEVIGVDYNLFVQVIYCEQNKMDLFLQIPRGQRIKRIDELLKIERFETARTSTVKLRNRISKSIEKRAADIKRLESDLKDSGKSGILKEIKQLGSMLEELDMEKRRSMAELEKIRKKVEILRKKEKRSRILRDTKIELESKIKQIDAGLSESDDKFGEYEDEFVGRQIAKLKVFLEEQKKMQRELVILDEKCRRINEEIGVLKEEVKDQGGKVGIAEKVTECMERIKKIRIEITEKGEDVSGHVAKKEVELKSVEELRCAEMVCPVCESNIDESRRKEIMDVKLGRIGKIERVIGGLKKEQMELTDKLGIEEKFYNENVGHIGAADEIKKLESKVLDRLGEHEKTETMRKEIKNRYSDEKIQKIEKEIKRFEKIQDILSMVKQKRDFLEELKQGDIEIKELGFDEKELKGTVDTFNSLDKECGVRDEKIGSAVKILAGKKMIIENIERSEKVVDEYRAEVDISEEKITELNKLSLVLEETQILLREEFIESINYTMSDFWNVLYPYKDYLDIRMFIEKDYALKLLNRAGKWVSVDGNVSGGEKMSAMIVLRLALAAVMVPGTGLMLMDEPTHNLDTKGITELAVTLREKISGLIGQTILITHEEMLESAVNGEIYRLERGDKKEGVTQVV